MATPLRWFCINQPLPRNRWRLPSNNYVEYKLRCGTCKWWQGLIKNSLVFMHFLFFLNFVFSRKNTPSVFVASLASVVQIQVYVLWRIWQTAANRPLKKWTSSTWLATVFELRGHRMIVKQVTWSLSLTLTNTTSECW